MPNPTIGYRFAYLGYSAIEDVTVIGRSRYPKYPVPQEEIPMAPVHTQTAADAVATALDAYKQRVYDAARKVKAAEDWCDDGFKKAMRDLDIDIVKYDPSLRIISNMKVGEVARVIEVNAFVVRTVDGYTLVYRDGNSCRFGSRDAQEVMDEIQETYDDEEDLTIALATFA